MLLAYIVAGGQWCCQTSYNDQDSTHDKEKLAKNVKGAKAEKVQGIFSLSDHKMIPPAIVLFKYDHKKCST